MNFISAQLKRLIRPLKGRNSVSASIIKNEPFISGGIFAVATVALLAISQPAMAATYTWDPLLSGQTSGASGGTGTWDLSTSNWWSGSADGAWVNDGTAVAAFGGLSAGTVTIGTNVSALGLQFLTTGYTLQSSSITLGGSGIDATALSSGTTTISSGIVLGVDQTWAVGSGATLAASGAVSGGFSLTKNGKGTLILGGINTYSGTTNVNAGTLSLTGSLSSATLSMGGGTFSFDKAGTNSQVFTTTNIGAGSSFIKNTVSTDTLNLGALTQTSIHGAVNFTNTGAIKTTTSNANGILGGWATANSGADWAANDGSGNIITYTGYNSLTGSQTPVATQNWKSGSSTLTVSASGTINSLYMSGGDVALTTNTLTLASGGLILGSSEKWFTATTGTLVSGLASGELYIHANTTGFTNGFQIQPVIVNTTGTTTAIVKDGVGQVDMANANNTFSGGFYLNAGSVYLGGSSTGAGASVTKGPLGTGIVTLNGGTLSLFGKSGASSVSVTLGNNINVPSGASVTIEHGNGNAGLSGDVSGGGSVTFQDSSTTNVTDTLTGNWNGFAGTMNYNGSASTSNFVMSGTGLDLSNAFVSFSNSASRTTSTFNTSGTTKFGSLSGFGYLNISGTAEIGNLNSSTTFTGNIANNASAGTLKKLGTGTLTLSGSNTYTGATNITSGALVVSSNGSINSSSGIAINGSGAKLVQVSTVAMTPAVTLTQGTVDGTGTINGLTVANLAGNTITNGNGAYAGTLTVGALTFNGSAAITICEAGTTKGLNVTGTLTTAQTGAGEIAVNAKNNVAWVSGTYNLFTYGSLVGSGSDFAMNTISGLGARQTGSLFLDTSAKALDLIISGATPIWTGAASGVWSTTSVGSPYNWKLNTDSSATEFLTNDQVQFDDTATGTTTLVINDNTVSPAGVIFSNDVKNYTLTGSNGINTGSVAKSGSAALTIANANSYSGGTTLNSGTLNLNNAGAIGTGALKINGGVLDNTSGSSISLSTNNTQVWAGSFGFAGTNPLNLGVGTVTLTTSPTITTSGSSSLTVGGAIGGAFGLTKDGTGTLFLSGANSYSGGTTITSGTLKIGNASSLSTGAVVNNATLDLNATNLSVSGFTGSGSVTSSAAGSATLSVTNSGVSTYSGVVQNGSGTVGLSVLGSGTYTLSGNNTFGGVLTQGAGVNLVLSGNNSGRPAGTAGTTVLNSTGALQLQANAGNTVSGTSFALGPESTASGGGLTWANGATVQLRSDSDVTFAGGGNLSSIVGTMNFDVNQTTASGSNNTFTFAPGGIATGNSAIVVNATGGNGDSLTLGNINVNFAQNITLNPTTANLNVLGIGNSVHVITKTGAGTLTTLGTVGTNYGPLTIAVQSGTFDYGHGSSVSVTDAVHPWVALTTGNGSTSTTVQIGDATAAANMPVGQLSISGSGSANAIVGGNSSTSTLTVNDYGNINTFAGTIGGTGANSNNLALVKSGSGALTLTGTNTYNGGTTLNSGTLTGTGPSPFGASSGSLTVNGSSSVLNLTTSAPTTVGSLSGTGSSTINNGGTGNLFTVNQTAAGSYAGNIAGNAGLALGSLSTNTLTLTGTSAFTGDTTINAGALVIGSAGLLGNGNYAGNIINSGSFAFNSSAAQTFSGVISGTGAVGDSGTGALTLTGNNTFTGVLTLGAGSKLILSGSNTARPGGTAGATVLNGTSTLQLQANSGNTVSGTSFALGPESTAANGALTWANGATVQLRADSNATFAGGNNLSNIVGTMNFDVNQVTASGSNNNFTFAPGGMATGNSAIVVNATGGNGDSLTLGSINVNFAQNITLNPTTANLNVLGIYNSVHVINKTGTGTLTTLGTVGTNYGPLTFAVQNGTFVFGHGSTLNVTDASHLGQADITLGNGVNSGTFQLGDATSAVNMTARVLSTSGAGTANAIVGGNSNVSTLTVNDAGNNSTFGGTIGGLGTNNNNLSLVKSGSGTLSLTGANTYNGGTTITNGVLSADNASGSATGSGQVAVNSGATLTGIGSVAGTVVVSGTLSGSVGVGSNLTVNSVGNLSGSHIFSGNVVLNNSTLSNVSSDIALSAGMTLSGTGGSTGAITATAGGSIVAPGNSGVGNLSLGSLNMATGAHLSMDINGTTAGSYDTVTVSNAISLSGGDLTLNIGTFTPGAQTIYLLINSSANSIGNAFDSVTVTGNGTLLSGNGGEGTQIQINGTTYSLTYAANYEGGASFGGNDAALVVAVPEPQTWAMLIGGLGTLGILQRGRRRTR